MKNFCFTVDDNIRCLKELTRGNYDSIFEHPYLAVYKRLHKRFDLKIQLNLFYEDLEFDLSEMTDRYAKEWKKCSDWLKLSFHSRLENVRPYISSGYDEVYQDCNNVQREICRFASPLSLGKTTTVHYCQATTEGLRALKDCGVKGLLGLYISPEKLMTSYQSTQGELELLRKGQTVTSDGISYASIDIVLNSYNKASILEQLSSLNGRELIKVMIHEQYFYPDYKAYQPDFEEKLTATFEYLTENGYKSVFLEETLKKEVIDYDSIGSIFFSDGGFFDGYTESTLLFSNEYAFFISHNSIDESVFLPDVYDVFFCKSAPIFKKLKKISIENWNSLYYADVCDGEQWELKIYSAGGNEILSKSGSNAFPDNFDKLTDLFDYVKKKCIPLLNSNSADPFKAWVKINNERIIKSF